MNRAYSLLQIKSIDEDARVIEGIATTPSTDRLGDIVEPKGAEFSLPLPFLWQHNAREPIGHVTKAKTDDDGITVRVELAKTAEPGRLKDRLDEAWQSIKMGLVRGLSIGFSPVDDPVPIKGTFGLRFTKWNWHELSAVTIPANMDATIQTVKQFDTTSTTARPTSTGRVTLLPPHYKPGTPMISETIKVYEGTLLAKTAERSALMDAATKKGVTLDDEESATYDALTAEMKGLSDHIVRLREQEKQNIKDAAAIGNPLTISDGGKARVTVPRVEVRTNVDKGLGFTRYALALLHCRGNRTEASQWAREQWPDHSELHAEFTKTAVAAGTTTDSAWAGPLVPITPLASEFVDLLRPQTLIGRIQGLRRVPFNVSVPKTTGGGAVSWVGQAKPKPVRALAFGTVTLPFGKAAGIVVLTKELVKLSSPAAQETVRSTMVDTMRVFLDTQFIDPTVAVSAGVSPASITNGVTGTAASGTTEAAARADLRAAVAVMAAANYPISELTWILSESVAFTLGTMVNALGQPAFPGLTVTGGNILGIPAVTSNVVGAQIVIAHANSVLYADDGQTEVDVSEQASVQMDDAPTDPLTSTQVMVSLWQANLVGLRFDRFATWLKARTDAVHRIHTVAYV